MRILGNRVLVQPLKPSTVSPGGIHYVEAFRDDFKQWRVIAVGSGRRLKSGVRLLPEVRPGDCVLLDPHVAENNVLPNGQRIVEARQIQMVWQQKDKACNDSLVCDKEA